MIYFDYAATTPLSEAALKTLYEVSADIFGNPSSVHAFGRKANQILREARQAVANCLETSPNHILFTSGGSEANNLAIKGYALANRDKGKHLITTAIEHHSVLHVMEDLETQHGFDVTILQPENGTITAQQVKEALRPDTLLVSVMHTNNETGLILPIAEIGQVLADHQAVFHVDAVQAIGKCHLAPEDLGIDLMSAAAHKFHGPKGIGFLFTTTKKLHPLIHGGNQEDKRRAGTENIAAIAAMATALTESLTEWEQNWQLVGDLKNHLVSSLSRLASSNTEPNLTYSPYVANLSFPNQLNERLLMQLDMAGFALSSGSACTAGNIEPSHVLMALYGAKADQIKNSLRISLSHQTSATDLDTLINQIKRIIGD